MLMQSSPPFFLTAIGILGLLIGSFLNVVISRIPKMLYQRWEAECKVFFQMDQSQIASVMEAPSTFNLITPASHCPHCQHSLKIYDNLPLLGFILLKGKCRHCAISIPWRYPLIEFVTALLSIITAYHFGVTLLTLAALFFTWSLICLAMIDYNHQLLPDDITLPTLWLGLFLNLHALWVPLDEAVLGAIAGYLLLWSMYWLFKMATKKEGMGYGDFKFLAMAGAWLGWKALLPIVLLSSIAGTAVGLLLLFNKRRSLSQPMPFGPFLATASWINLILGDKIHLFYADLLYVPK